MTIWMVTGLHDRRWLDNALQNYVRQDYGKKRLILVRNGPVCLDDSLSMLSEIGVDVLQSKPGSAQPLNAALAWLRAREQDNDWFAKCDADDYYGPQYLASIQTAIDSGADYCGRSSIYIRTTTDRLWYVEGDSTGHVFHGPTLAARVGAAQDFPEVADWGEDELWCQSMRKHQAKPCCLPAEGFCYQRCPEYRHSWPCTDRELRTAWPKPFLDLGLWNSDVVNGVLPRPKGMILEPPDCGIDDFMTTRVLKEKLYAAVNVTPQPNTKAEQAMSDRRRIQAPTNVITISGSEKQYYTFDLFVLWAINGDRRFNTDGPGIRASVRIEKALSKLPAIAIDPKPETPEPEKRYLVLKKEDFDLLLASVNEPQQTSGIAYPLSPARAIMPWIQAIEDATPAEED